jgi:DNA-directed RNA polymerase specialized sigma24 family protein
VDPPTSLKKEWALTKEAFDGLLAMLDKNRDRAGQKYEAVRLRLVKFFQWSGAIEPDVLADETLNRVARKIEEGANIYNLNAFIQGVAKLVKAESLRNPIRKHLDIEEAYDLAAPIDEDPEKTERRVCLDRCLGNLPEENREVIIIYYENEKGIRIECRKRLAARLGMTANALRINAHRIRMSLETCVKACLGHCS